MVTTHTHTQETQKVQLQNKKKFLEIGATKDGRENQLNIIIFNCKIKKKKNDGSQTLAAGHHRAGLLRLSLFFVHFSRHGVAIILKT